MEKVFVYGTLLKGEYNNRHLETSNLLGNAEVSGLEMRNLGPFPACTPSLIADRKVVGEVWEIDEETFARLDRLEGYPRFYNRMEVETPYGIAWVYIIDIPDPHWAVIESGSWKQYREERGMVK